MLSEISQTEKYRYSMISLTHGILKRKQMNKQRNATNSQMQKINKWSPEGRAVGVLSEIDERDEEVQTSSYKINKPRGCNI